MKARLYAKQDYQAIKSWWKGHDVPEVAEALLPPLGVVVFDEEKEEKLAVCWIYLACNVGVSWLAWLTTNPDMPPLQSARVIRFLVSAAQNSIPDEYNFMVAMPMQESYMRLLQSEGFLAAHTCTEMFKFIKR